MNLLPIYAIGFLVTYSFLQQSWMRSLFGASSRSRSWQAQLRHVVSVMQVVLDSHNADALWRKS